MKKQITILYSVLHHEIFENGERGYRADEMLFYITSSMEKALEFIKSSGVAPYSWWEIQVSQLDEREWPEHVGWYGLRGGKLKAQPYQKCVELYKKCKADENHELDA
jgi:hypothetical protein